MTEHVVVLHRWRDRYADYARYLDHDRYAVTYVTTDVGIDAVPPTAREVVVVPATDDLPAVRAEVRDLASRFGAPVGIVALKEDDLLVAAQLRAEWGCPGPTVAETNLFRDKLVMSQAVAEAGIKVPAFAAVSEPEDVHAFAASHGWPVVLKPRASSSSEGVVVVTGPADLPAEVGGMLVQAFSSGDVHHVDGVFDGREITAVRVSRYLRTCLEFRTGTPLGSVEIEDHHGIGEFARRVLGALTTKPVVFHLEVFVDGDELRFLEVGARAGGAEIPFLWREVHGYDLNEAAFRVALGESPESGAPLGGDVGGWLIVPAPAERPCRIHLATPMLGTVPGLYAEVVLREGEILPAADAYYEHVGGRFRFRGRDSEEVSAAITAVARDFRISGATLAPDMAS